MAAVGFVFDATQVYPVGASAKLTPDFGKQIVRSMPASGLTQLGVQFCEAEATALQPVEELAVIVTICPIGIPVTVLPESTPLSD